MKKFLPVLGIASLLLTSCYQTPCTYMDDAPELDGYYRDEPIVVYEGEYRTFGAGYVYGSAETAWGSPDGSLVESDSLKIGPMTEEMAGEYRLLSIDDDCIKSTTFHVVFESIDPPCTLPENTIKNKTTYKKSTIYTNDRYNSYTYEITFDDGSSLDMVFREKPKPGVYDGDGYNEYNALLSVDLFYRESWLSSRDKPSYSSNSEIPVYIRRVNGQLEATFCEIEFSSSRFGNKYNVSANIVLE